MGEERGSRGERERLETPPTDPEGLSRLAPFEDFSTAARAVFGRFASFEEIPVEELIGRLLSTVLVGEERARAVQDRAEQAEVDASADPLTGLANRRGWMRLLSAEEERCRRHGVETSVIVVDLDDLKGINDARGHAAGDDVLQSTARAILSCTRRHDAVARLGGDEFAILAVHCPQQAADILSQRVVGALTPEGISASVGVATRRPPDGLHAAWEDADAAMYRVKRRDQVHAVEAPPPESTGSARAWHTRADPETDDW